MESGNGSFANPTSTTSEIKQNGNVNNEGVHISSSHQQHSGHPGGPYYENTKKDTVVETSAGGNGTVFVQPVNLSASGNGGPQRPKNPFVDPSQRHASPVDMKGRPFFNIGFKYLKSAKFIHGKTIKQMRIMHNFCFV